MIGIARFAGRGVTRLLLIPIVLYFLCTGGAARAASADYLERVLGRRPGWRDHARHLYCFAACTLDRVFLLGASHSLEVVSQRDDALKALLRDRRGFLFICSHLGSFEALRSSISVDVRTPVRIVMDRLHNPTVTGLFEALNPQLAAQVIDAGDGGPQLVLALREALESGAMVGLMGDRVRDGERSAEVDFLGGRARLPLSPWI
ncbi:MAG: acyltransferase, partial [Panacagrimonas sp.]